MGLAAVAPPEWVGTAEASELTGRSPRQLARLVQGGVLTRRKDKETGHWEYKKSVLLTLAEPEETDAAADLLDVARTLIVTMGEPCRLFVEATKAEMARLSARCAELEKVHTEMVVAREAALSEEFAREMQATQLEASETRKTAALAQGLQVLNAVVADQKASKLLASFTNEQIDQLLQVGDVLLKPEQQAALKAFRDGRAKAAMTASQTEAA